MNNTTCQHCGSVIKTYKRSLNSGIVRALLEIVKKHLQGNDWVDIRTIAVRGGDYAKLAYWGLAVRGKPGFWKPTQLGMDFAMLKKAVPKHVFVDKGIVVGVASEMTTVNSALKEKFSYLELMDGFLPWNPQIEMEMK